MTYENGQYVDGEVNPVEGVDIKSYAGAIETPITKRLGDPGDPFRSVEGKQVYEKLSDTRAALQTIIKDGGITSKNEHLLPGIVSDLRYRIKNSPSVLERQEAAKLYSNLKNKQLIDPEEIAKVLKSISNAKNSDGLMKTVDVGVEEEPHEFGQNLKNIVNGEGTYTEEQLKRKEERAIERKRVAGNWRKMFGRKNGGKIAK